MLFVQTRAQASSGPFHHRMLLRCMWMLGLSLHKGRHAWGLLFMTHMVKIWEHVVDLP
ncbi:hypothetical protein Gogos_010354, partial [Gossypium gossypioides]|nr:hypothetical protein [Gossypium gossypioides]